MDMNKMMKAMFNVAEFVDKEFPTEEFDDAAKIAILEATAQAYGKKLLREAMLVDMARALSKR